jgi:putative spermidine/putrescine transport system permease protein
MTDLATRPAPEAGAQPSSSGGPARRNRRPAWPWLLLVPAAALFAAGFLLPQGWLLVESVRDPETGDLGLSAYQELLTDGYWLAVFARTVAVGVLTVAVCAFIGFPLAYQLARSTSRWRPLLLALTVFPLLTSAVVRTFGWQVLFYPEGALGKVADLVGISLLGTVTGVVIALAEVLLPFMVLTCYGVLTRIDPAVEEAALDLGDPPLRVLLRVTVPLARGGILAGSVLVFSLAVSSFITPALIGGARVQVAATAIYQQAISMANYQRASAIGVLMFFVVIGLLLVYGRLLGTDRKENR